MKVLGRVNFRNVFSSWAAPENGKAAGQGDFLEERCEAAILPKQRMHGTRHSLRRRCHDGCALLGGVSLITSDILV